MKKKKIPSVLTRAQKLLHILKNHQEFNHELEKSQNKFIQSATWKNTGKEKVLVSWNDKVLQQETSRIMQIFPSLPNSWEANIRDYVKTGVLTPPVSSTMPKVSLEKIEGLFDFLQRSS